jgi:putative oxidoreductase
MALLLVATRLMLAWVFLRSGLDVLRKPEPRAATAAWLLDSVRAWIPSLPADNVLLVRANAAIQLGAGASLALGMQPRLAALALATSMVPTTVGGHPFWRQDDPTRRAQHLVHFEKNLAILGGLLVVVLGTPFGNRRGR